MHIVDLAIGFIMGITAGLLIGFLVHHHNHPNHKHFSAQEKDLRIALIIGLCVLLLVIIILLALI